jgi:N-acetylglutamate synthase-like GNAT family acetyltransferase
LIFIREARADDLKAIVRIYIESWNAGFTTLMPTRTITTDVMAQWTRDLAKPVPQRWWVAETDEAVVGFTGICPSRDPIDPAIGEVDTIAVDPLQWRAGIWAQTHDDRVRASCW